MASKRSNKGMSNNSGKKVPARNPSARNVNYGPADEFEIWEVARAATAAPFYFDPLKIKISGSSMSLTDAGFGHNNNPTKEGTNEIEELYGVESIGIVVSVGTARKDEGDLKRGLFAFKGKVRQIALKATDTEQVHRDMDAMSSKDGFSYYRLNDPDGLTMQLDEWEPKPSRLNSKNSGSKTLEKLRIAFDRWAIDNTHQLQECAGELVKCRRARSKRSAKGSANGPATSSANDAKWERYATGAEFTCQIRGCEREKFDDCEEFKHHLKRDHGMKSEDYLKREVTECKRDWRYQLAA